jgi:cell division protein FtsQ
MAKRSTQQTSDAKARPNRRRGRVTAAAAAPARRGLKPRFAAASARVRTAFARVRKPLFWAGRALVLGAVTAGAVATGRLLERHVRNSAAFATTTIDVTGNSRLSRDEVLAAAGLALGQNIFEISPEQARSKLESQPWVAEASVARKLPGSYAVQVHEQKPAALLLLETLYLVSEEGSVFKRLEAGDPIDLPVITGVDPAQFRADRAFRTQLLVNAVALLHDYRDAGLWKREPIAEIHADTDGSVALYVGSDSMEVRLGQAPFRKKLSRLRGILDELKDDAGRPAYVYLDNVRRPDRVAVRLR